MATTHDADFQALMKGLTSWDIPTGPVPSELLLTREAAFPVLVNDEGQVTIAASSYSKGRYVVMGHEGYLMHPPLAPFLANAVRWLCSTPGAPIIVHPSVQKLAEILKVSGIEAQVQEEPPMESVGVYCFDAYTHYMTQKLTQLVKRGGGVLIGGQGWSFLERYGIESFLNEFPGNQAISLSGIFINKDCMNRKQWVFSETVPTTPIHVTSEHVTKKDQQQLLKGITELDISRGQCPSKLLVHGPQAFPLGIDSLFNCFLAAAHYGHGQVVLCGNESMMFDDKMDTFMMNALHWLKGQQKGKIGVHSQLQPLSSLLARNNLEWRSTDIPTSDLSVYCCSSLNEMHVKNMEEFVAEGGGVLMGSHAGQWAKQHPDSNFLIEYPNNMFLKQVGLSIIKEEGQRGRFSVPKQELLNYHVRKALPQFESMLFNNGRVLENSWMEMLKQDSYLMLQIPHDEIPIYKSVHNKIMNIIKQKGLPPVNEDNPISRGSPQDILTAWARGLAQSGTDSSLIIDGHSSPPATESTISIEINTDNRDSWVSTGLYLPEGQVATVTLPKEAVTAQLKMLIGCHTDDISELNTQKRAPKVTREYNLNKTNTSISWFWGGLLYILVPSNYNMSSVLVTISGAMPAPYFKLGKTSQEEWKRSLQGNPAPWGELATDNIILTVPTENLKAVKNPNSLLQLWDEIMQAAATLGAEPFPYRRPERIVTDVQLQFGVIRTGYPIMAQVDLMSELIDEKTIRSSGSWNVFHILGHRQQRPGWQFPPHSTEADCNLWNVYLHEEVLDIPRARAHPNLTPEHRQERIRKHMDTGAPLRLWNSWTALETYLQLQEGFGWEPFTQLFAHYQMLSNYPKDNTGRMNLWMKKFSEIVQKNLVPFFYAWGWPIQKEVADSLASLPEWEENPMKVFIVQCVNCGIVPVFYLT
ncbi:TRPM8 channel-associated factor 3-like [Ochotona princeps]|uniref:TRPM8 channel-associated factor 3-like n=1 Tax=Ochotona princeps TaxID=9978 RepID=UPI0027151AA4|nr:TRPM8 channel-associated factor 3-like [Ochotona princeps]